MDELSTDFFRRGIILSEGEIAGVHAILHELIEVGAGMMGNINAMGGDLAVNSGGWMVQYHISRAHRAQSQEESN